MIIRPLQIDKGMNDLYDSYYIVYNILCKNKKYNKAFNVINNLRDDILMKYESYSQSNFLRIATIHSKKHLIYMLKKNNFDKNILKKQNMYGNNCLVTAIKNNPKNFFIIVEKYFNKSIYNSVSSTGKTLLHYACIKKRIKIIKFLIDHKFCSKDYFDKQDKNGKTCLMFCKDNLKIVNILLSSKFITYNSLLLSCNEGYNIFLMSCLQNNGLLQKLLNMKICSQIIVNSETYKSFNCIILSLSKKNNKELEYLLESHKLSKKTFQRNSELFGNCIIFSLINNKKYFPILLKHKYCDLNFIKKKFNGKNILHYCCLYGKNNEVKHLIKNNLVSNDMFKQKSENNIPLNTFQVNDTNYNNQKIIFDSDYTTEEILKENNVFYEACYKNIEFARYLLNSPKYTKELLNYGLDPINRNPVYNILATDKQFLFEYLSSPKFDKKYLNSSIFYYLYNDYINFKKFLENEFCNSNLFKLYEGKKLIHLLFMYSNNKIINYFLKSKWLTKEIFQEITPNGETIFHFSVGRDTEILELVLSNKYFTKEMFNKKDINLRTAIDYFFTILPENTNEEKYFLNLQKIFDHKYMTKEIFNNIGINNTTYLMLGCKSLKILEYLLAHKYCNKNLFDKKDVDNYNLLCYTIEHNNKTTEIILKNKYLTKNNFDYLITCNDNNNINILHLAVNYENKDLKLLLEHEYCSEEMFNFTNIANETILTISSLLNDTENIKAILESKYISKNFMKKITKSNGNCIISALNEMSANNNQYETLKLLINNEYFDKEMLQYEDSKGLNVLMLSSLFYPECLKLIYEPNLSKLEIELDSVQFPKRLDYLFDKYNTNDRIVFYYIHILAMCNPHYIENILDFIDSNDLLLQDGKKSYVFDFLLNGYEHIILIIKNKFKKIDIQSHIDRLLIEYDNEYIDNILIDNDKEIKYKGFEESECKICMDNELSTVINPCGHMICKLCSLRLEIMKCPFCKEKIDDFINININ